nr:hypothetical protein [Pseudomonas aeruginosa]
MKVMKWSAIALAVSAGSTQFAVADAFVSVARREIWRGFAQ